MIAYHGKIEGNETTLTEDHIKKLLELEAKTTERPWHGLGREIRYCPPPLRGFVGNVLDNENSNSNALFIGESRNIFRELAEDWLRMRQKETK